jgi:hypothetical protein
MVWTDRSGQLTTSPVQSGTVAAWIALAGSLAVLCVGVLLALVGLLAHWLFDRHRLSAWDARWAVTEPQWSRRR